RANPGLGRQPRAPTARPPPAPDAADKPPPRHLCPAATAPARRSPMKAIGHESPATPGVIAAGQAPTPMVPGTAIRPAIGIEDGGDLTPHWQRYAARMCPQFAALRAAGRLLPRISRLTSGEGEAGVGRVPEQLLADGQGGGPLPLLPLVDGQRVPGVEQLGETRPAVSRDGHERGGFHLH